MLRKYLFHKVVSNSGLDNVIGALGITLRDQIVNHLVSEADRSASIADEVHGQVLHIVVLGIDN